MAIYWLEGLETGVDLIDTQHQQLFAQADMLLNSANPERVPETLHFLATYINNHFHDEENLMALVAYPQQQEHHRHHRRYVKSLQALIERYEAEGQRLSLTLAVYNHVVSWLREHILVHDMAFASYYREQQPPNPSS